MSGGPAAVGSGAVVGAFVGYTIATMDGEFSGDDYGAVVGGFVGGALADTSEASKRPPLARRWVLHLEEA